MDPIVALRLGQNKRMSLTQLRLKTGSWDNNSQGAGWHCWPTSFRSDCAATKIWDWNPREKRLVQENQVDTVHSKLEELDKKSSKPPDTIFFFGFQTMICSLQKCLLSLMTVHISVANAHGDKPQTILNWAQLHNSSSFSPPAQTTPSSVPLPPYDPPGSNPSLSDFLSPGDSTLPPLSTSTRPTSIQPIKFPTVSKTSLSHPT